MDQIRLVYAFENVINNAIQHSEAGSVVEVTCGTVSAGDRTYIECKVRDRGPGFREDDLPRVFEPFFTRRRGGTGLGLSIVQRVVDEHGGSVAAGNDPDGGASVVIRLPVYQPGSSGSAGT
jgi:signal transduction histidine kinase